MIMSYLLTAFILMPLVELVLLIKLNQQIGFAYTVAIVILTGVTGATLARMQGFLTVRAIQRDLAEGRMPAPRLIDGVMILIAGVLLVTPGLITDAIGFLLLLPPIRSSIRMWMRAKLEEKLKNGSTGVTIWRW